MGCTLKEILKLHARIIAQCVWWQRAVSLIPPSFQVFTRKTSSAQLCFKSKASPWLKGNRDGTIILLFFKYCLKRQTAVKWLGIDLLQFALDLVCLLLKGAPLCKKLCIFHLFVHYHIIPLMLLAYSSLIFIHTHFGH